MLYVITRSQWVKQVQNNDIAYSMISVEHTSGELWGVFIKAMEITLWTFLYENSDKSCIAWTLLRFFPLWWSFNTLRLRQNGRHFPDNIFKCIFLNENILISIKNSLKFIPTGLINNIPALIQIMTWHRSGDKPLSETMMVRSLTHICVTRPQWVNKDLHTNGYE